MLYSCRTRPLWSPVHTYTCRVFINTFPRIEACKHKVDAHLQTAAHSCTRPPWSSLWRPDRGDTTPAQCRHHYHCTQATRAIIHVQTNIPTSKQTSLRPSTSYKQVHKYSVCFCAELHPQGSTKKSGLSGAQSPMFVLKQPVNKPY